MKAKHVFSPLIGAVFAFAASSAAVCATTYTYVDLGDGPNGKDAFGYGESTNAQTGSYFDHAISCGKDCTSKDVAENHSDSQTWERRDDTVL